MEHTIRRLNEIEYPLLADFLYEAIYIPMGVEAPPRSIIELPELQVYIDGFGSRNGDTAVCAEAGGRVVGTAWARIMDDYGHIDNNTPSIAISLYKDYRGHGIGTELMIYLLEALRRQGFCQVSLAVQKENYAVRMYKNVGFETIDENSQEYIMICRL